MDTCYYGILKITEILSHDNAEEELMRNTQHATTYRIKQMSY